MKQIDWYFDFISPFAYLASESLQRLPKDIELRPRPALFAGMLKHWETRGPAEIEPMRRFTFRHVRWLADRDHIALTMPPAHPFNPLRLLRLSIAAGGELAQVQEIFRFIWAHGESADDPLAWQSLIDSLGITDAEAVISAPEVKDRLRQNTEQAIRQGVFGVPSFVVDDEIFWGYDSLGFLLDYLQYPETLNSPGMRAADEMPEGLQRQS